MNAVAFQTSAARFPWRWLAFGVLAYAVFVVATFPAARLVNRLQGNGIMAAGVTGSLWSGSAGAIQANGIVLGTTSWRISPWRLLLGTLSAEIHTKRDDGYADATVRVGFGGALTVRDLRGSFPINALSGLGIPGGVNGWNGTIQLQLDEVALTKRWPTAIKGTIQVADLVGPAQQPTQLGGYRITFPGSRGAPATKDASELIGSIASFDDSPLDVIGSIRLAATRNYVIDAQVATRPSAPASIIKALQYLGPPDANGRRPLSVAGSL